MRAVTKRHLLRCTATAKGGHQHGFLFLAIRINNSEIPFYHVGAILHNPDLLEASSKGLAIKALWQVRELEKSGKKTIIFLDEPTSNLDPAATRMVKDLILDLTKKADKTVFICTHLLDAAEELCDLIGIIDKGELKVQGSPKEIIESAGAKDLEGAYLKLMGATRIEDLLSWREENPNNDLKQKKKKKKKKDKKRTP